MAVPVRVHAFSGDVPESADTAALRAGVHVVVGTPGRVYAYLMDSNDLKLDSIKLLVLDEADRMLDRGFKDQIYDIFASCPPRDMQVALFTYTMPEEALALAAKFMVAPVTILLKREELTLDGKKQYYIPVEREEWKLDTLCDVFEALPYAIVVYCNTRAKVDWLVERMTSREFAVSDVREFHLGGTSRMIITTDLLARGIDTDRVSVVINYDLPLTFENYLHRISRTSSSPRGVAINFITTDDVGFMRDIEAHFGTSIPELPADLATQF